MVVATLLGEVRDITAPGLVLRRNVKLSIQHVREQDAPPLPFYRYVSQAAGGLVSACTSACVHRTIRYFFRSRVL
ncbi:hypothetical protein D3C76_1766290 [compost metagenome]